MSDCRLTTFDNPYDPFEQFALWMLFDNRNGYNTCGKIDRLTHYSDDMSEKEFDDEHERVIDEIIDNDFLNIYKKCTEIKRIQIQIPQRWLNRSERYRGGSRKSHPLPTSPRSLKILRGTFSRKHLGEIPR